MGDDITIGVTEIVNNIEVTAQPNDQIVDISVTDNADNVTLNITPTVVEVNINKGSSFAQWGDLYGTLSDQTDLQNALNLKANLVDGKVPASELPSYVDDIIEVANYAALPATGETGKIYVTLDNNKIFRWSGSAYIEIAANNAVWGMITGTLSSQTDLNTALGLKVPYTGATGNVNLGNYTLSSYDLVVNHTSGSGTAATISKGGNGEALTVTKSSGTGNVASFSGGITAISELSLTTDLSILNGGTGSSTASGARTNLGATTVGSNVFTSTNPSAITFLRANADNTVSWLDASTFRTAIGAGTGSGTVTSVAALTLGTTGTDITSTVANGTTTPVITLNIPTASATNRGALSAANWTTFNNKQNALNGTGFVKISGTTISYDNSTYVPTSRTITINGVSWNLSSDVSFTAGVWGAITGTLSEQTDLQAALDLKANDASVVKLTGDQDISGKKSFNLVQTGYDLSLITSDIYDDGFISSNNGMLRLVNNTTDADLFRLESDGAVFAKSFIKSGGTASQFLKANGTVDSTTYLSGTVAIANGGTGATTAAAARTNLGATTIGANIFTSTNPSAIRFLRANADNTASWLDANNFRIAIGAGTGNGTVTSVEAVGSYGGLTLTGTVTGSGQITLGGTPTGTWPISVSGNAASVNTVQVSTNADFYLTFADANNGSPTSEFLYTIGSVKVNPSSGALTAGSFVKSGGLSTEYLMADGSVSTGGGVSGTGTTNYIPKFTGASAIGNSLLYDNGTNVGIGTTSPSTKLEVNSGTSTGPTLRLATTGISVASNTLIGEIDFYNSDATTPGARSASYIQSFSAGTSGGGDLRFGVSANAATVSEAMRITSAGNVGIGTTSPAAKLTVNGQVLVTDNSLQGFYQSRTSDTVANGVYGGNSFVLRNGATSEDLNFDIFNRSSSAWYTPMVIKNTGNVGIGTTSPSGRLTVYGGQTEWGDTSSLGFLGYSGGDALVGAIGNRNFALYTNGSERMRITSGGQVQILNSATFGANGNLRLTSDSSNGQIVATSGKGLQFYTNDGIANPMNITSGGNVGIGTTSPGYKLQVDSGSNIASFRSIGSGENNKQIVLRSGGDRSIIEASNASDGTDTNLAFNTASNERMRITSGGNVGIRTTSPESGWNVDIAGIVAMGSTAGNGRLYISCANTTNGITYIQARNLSVGTPMSYLASSHTFDTNVTAPGFFNSSDIRLKEIVDYNYNVLDIKPITYLWKDGRDNKKHVGYSAQEVQKVMPDAVNEGTDGFLSVNYVEVLVAKIAELETRIKQLEK